jgi:hypothetical protein
VRGLKQRTGAFDALVPLVTAKRRTLDRRCWFAPEHNG